MRLLRDAGVQRVLDIGCGGGALAAAAAAGPVDVISADAAEAMVRVAGSTRSLVGGRVAVGRGVATPDVATYSLLYVGGMS
jgi:2-polyprenyl-3-methyl-5-hydroxy-6-metoxy-1,4-benzoquinol methylase